MAIEEVPLADVIAQIGQIGLWLQALGIIVIAWVIFQIISLVLNRKRLSQLMDTKNDVARIERKIDKLIKICDSKR